MTIAPRAAYVPDGARAQRTADAYRTICQTLLKNNSSGRRTDWPTQVACTREAK